MPEEVTVEEVEQLHIDAWQLGLKAVAIYRDNCKVAQPLSTAKKDGAERRPTPAAPPRPAEAVVERIVEKIVHEPVRQKLPRTRALADLRVPGRRLQGLRHRRRVRGRPSRRDLPPVSKQGSTLAGIMDAFAISISYGLQYGVPLRASSRRSPDMRFEPAGMTDDPDIRFATQLMDYLFRRLAIEYLSLRGAGRARHPHHRRAHRSPRCPVSRRRSSRPVRASDVAADPPSIESASTLVAETDHDRPPGSSPRPTPVSHDAPMCMQCGVQMQRAGSCHACPSCGSTSGCS